MSLVLQQPEPHEVPVLQAHVPFEQVMSAPQEWPHVPQLELLVWVFTQLSRPQPVSPAPQQYSFAHESVDAHCEVLVQAWPAVALGVHTPLVLQ